MKFYLLLMLFGFHSALCEIECGSSIKVFATDKLQNFTSPLYPKYYPRPLSCSWLFKTRNPNARIHFQLVSFNLTRSAFCSADYFKIKDGPSIISPTIFNWCGLKPSGTRFSTIGNTALIFFSALDTGQPASGFYIKFWEEEKGKIVERDPIFTSVHYALAGIFASVLALFVVGLIYLILTSLNILRTNKVTHSLNFQ